MEMESQKNSKLLASTVNAGPMVQIDKHSGFEIQSSEELFLNYLQEINKFLVELWISSSWLDLVISILKYLPTGLCLYKFFNKIFVTARQMKKQKQIELDEIQAQISLMNSKLRICEREQLERLQQVRADVQRLREMRARVRELVPDEALRHALGAGSDADLSTRISTDDSDLAKELQKLIQDNRCSEEKERGEQAREHSSTPDSAMSSLGDVDPANDCNLKIIKVTNVYKVAYLRHYIKQKRLRRASRQALLKKKMENIKKMLEEWQKALNGVITRTLNLEERSMETTSQEAMGDYWKQNFRDGSCSDSDVRTDIGDACYEDYSSSWVQQNSYGNFHYEHNTPEALTRKEYNGESVPCVTPQTMARDVNPNKGLHSLFVLPEETSSQIEFEELKRETEQEYDMQNFVAA